MSAAPRSSLTVSLTWGFLNKTRPLLGCGLDPFLFSSLTNTFISTRLRCKTRKQAEREEKMQSTCALSLDLAADRSRLLCNVSLQSPRLFKGDVWNGRQQRWRQRPQRQIAVPHYLHFMDDIIKLPRQDWDQWACLCVCVCLCLEPKGGGESEPRRRVPPACRRFGWIGFIQIS